MRRPLLLLALACLPGCKTATTSGQARAPAATESGAFGTPIAGADASPLDPTTSSGAFANPGAGPSGAGRDSRTADRQRIADLRPPDSAASPPGSSRDHPLPTCGTNGSYAAVADAECEDGSRPFDGDLSSGKRARRGSVGADKDGHVVDLYEVPCPEGSKEIFVDMYACERAQPTRSTLERDTYVRDAFLAGDHARFSERCFAEDARGPGRMTLMLQACVPIMPTALREQGKLSEAHAWLARYCAGTVDERERWSYFRNVLDMLDVLREEQGRSAGDRATERKQLAREYAKVCAVDLKAFEAWVKDNPG